MAGFGFAGAAGGVQRSLEQMLLLRRQAFLDQQALQQHQQEMAIRQQEADRLARLEKLQEAATTVQQLDATGQGAPISPEIAQSLQGTPYAARLQTKSVLPSTSQAFGTTTAPTLGGAPGYEDTSTPAAPRVIDGLSPRIVDQGGQSETTLRPTDKQAEQSRRDAARVKLVQLFQRGTPPSRSEVLGALADSGENITGALLNDPAEAARVRAEEAATQSEANRQNQLAIATMNNETRRDLASFIAANRNANADLQRQILEGRIQDQQDKRDASAAAQKAKDDAVSQYENDIRSTLGDLIDAQGHLKPDVAAVVGPLDAHTWTIRGTSQAALAKIDRLIGLLDINKLREMKAQSKTGASGFGALSEKELAVLESAASTLRNRGQDEGSYASELQRIATTLNGAGKTPPPAPTRVRYDINGNRIP